MKPRLILILGDQLTPSLTALTAARAGDVVIMAEVMGEATYTPHHPQKLVLFFAAMRKFSSELQRLGLTVAYTKLDDPDNTQSITGEIIRRAAEYGAGEVIATQSGDWRLRAALDDCPIPVTTLPDTRFICPEGEFTAWAAGKKQLRMEYFYREMRRKTGLLMDGDQPILGRWNFDAENRKPASTDLLRPKPPRFAPDAETLQVIDIVRNRFNHFGSLDNFGWATTRADALVALDHFIAHALPRFGAEQDAMLGGDPFLSHSLISPYINLGLLDPIEVCQRAEAEYHAHRAPIEAVEGFIRQIIGWREYMRGIYLLQGPEYLTRNALEANAKLPSAYWGGPTKMACIKAAVGQTEAHAYAHHIQRLMVTGNFALLAGISPQAVHEWYLSVYIDAVEWVCAPNTLGMSQFADGGVIASKPYMSSGAYINRMSDYCRGCAYDVAQKTGESACPFNSLYWHFLHRHRARFSRNARMGQMYRVWDNMAAGHRETVLRDGEAILEKLAAGSVV
ncbi:MAG: cryptochrome/photolyase family protein [Cypionkella sp.]|nr:cryptochrome/photolyase family protein [Cypionkella sp.]